MAQDRGHFSRIGFILAAAGSAVGLGNIWRFPTTVGSNGGGLFVLLYIVSVILIALPVLIAEITLGRATGKNPVGAFMAIQPGTPWKFVGYLGVITAFMILSYYSVIAGRAIGYFVKALLGHFSGMTAESSTAMYSQFTVNFPLQLGLLILFILLTVYVVSRGVSGGIERYSKILMPVLLGILCLLLIRSLTLKGAMRGIEFYLKPDFSAFNARVVVAAMGQAFFSLSLGMGTMITYGSYISKKDNIPASAGWITLFDTGIAIFAGFIIFPAIFALGMDPNQGSGIMFNTLPVLFAKMPGGSIFGAFFFLLLSIAALTSTISILEVAVAYYIDEKKKQRTRAAAVIGFVALLFGIPSALSDGAVPFLTDLPVVKMGWLGLWDYIWGNMSLAIGAFFIALFVGYAWKTSNALAEIRSENQGFRMAGAWTFAIKYVVPVFILAIFIGLLL